MRGKRSENQFSLFRPGKAHFSAQVFRHPMSVYAYALCFSLSLQGAMRQLVPVTLKHTPKHIKKQAGIFCTAHVFCYLCPRLKTLYIMQNHILSITGRPGLYKLLKQGRGMLIVESVDNEHRRMPVGERDKVVSLNDISIYTDEDDKPLMEVFEAIKAKENGEPVKFNPKKASASELHEYFASVLPSYDRDRVFDNDLRKLFTWYNILVGNGITDFVDEEEKPAEPADAENGDQK